MAPNLWKTFWKKLRTNFFTGFFLLIPVIGSVYIFLKLFKWAGSMLPLALGVQWHPVVGLSVSVIIICLVGFVAKSYIGRKIIAVGNAVIVSIPLLSKIYLIIKQIIDAVTIDKKKLFERVVLLEFPRKESFVIGLVTSEDNGKFSAKAGRKLVAVFVPTAPNPTTGFLIYVPEEDLINIDIPVEAAFKLVVSGGILGTENFGNAMTLVPPAHQWKWTDIFVRMAQRKNRHPPADPRD
jgi:uncharacterized membrane protein